MTKNLFQPYQEEIQNLLKPKKKRKKNRLVNNVGLPTERQEQRIVIAWLKKNGIPCQHSPNGGFRNKIEAYNLKLDGVSAGFPDIEIPVMRLPYGGLYIEMKPRGRHIISDAQKYWIKLLQENGQRAEVCIGADQAIELVKSYMML